MKEYYLRHKYLSDLDGVENNYLNVRRSKTLHISIKEDNNIFKTQFTEYDIKILVNEFGLNLSEFDKVEVE